MRPWQKASNLHSLSPSLGAARTELLTLPDGTVWSSATRSDGTVRDNQADQVPFLMKLDISSTQGVGAGTTGWAKMMDESHPGGAELHFADGDTNGELGHPIRYLPTTHPLDPPTPAPTAPSPPSPRHSRARTIPIRPPLSCPEAPRVGYVSGP